MQYKNLNDKFGSILKVDIDRRKISFFTVKSIQLLSRNFTLQKLIIKRSPSKKGWHIVLCIKEQMTDSEIIAWQFALNSDRKRERYNLLRHTHGNTMKDWNILFEKKVKRKINFQDRILDCHTCPSFNLCANVKSRKYYGCSHHPNYAYPPTHKIKTFHGQPYKIKIKKKKDFEIPIDLMKENFRYEDE